MHQEQDTESPGQPHGGAVCAQQGACRRKHSSGSGAAKQGGWAKTGAGHGAMSLGIPLPTVLILAERKDNTIYLREGIRNKTRVESRRSLF